jgi:hypothetical protein
VLYTGSVMRQQLTAMVIFPMAAAVAMASEPLHWTLAGDHVGEERLIEGAVVAIRREGHVLRLAFDGAPDSFTVALIVGLLSPLPADPEAVYVGQTVRALGKIRRFRGVPEMVIRDPTRITIVGAVSAAAVEAELRDRVEGLERRMERIERRLDELQK